MGLVSRRTFVKVAAGLVAFIPATRALAAPPNSLPVGQAAPRIAKYVGGRVSAVGSGQLSLHSYDGEYTLRLAPTSEVWKGAWDRNAVIEVGDRIDAWGTRQPRGIFDVERMWVNIVNLIGPVSNVRQSTDRISLTQRDRHRGSLPVLIDRQTVVVSNGHEQAFAAGTLTFVPGQAPQIIGLLLKNGTVHATRVFV